MMERMIKQEEERLNAASLKPLPSVVTYPPPVPANPYEVKFQGLDTNELRRIVDEKANMHHQMAQLWSEILKLDEDNLKLTIQCCDYKRLADYWKGMYALLETDYLQRKFDALGLEQGLVGAQGKSLK